MTTVRRLPSRASQASLVFRAQPSIFRLSVGRAGDRSASGAVKKVAARRGAEKIKEKFSASSLQETDEAPTQGEYQCTGNLEQDYMELCTILGILEIPKIVPRIHQVTPVLDKPTTDETEETRTSENQLHDIFSYLKPRIQVDMENEDLKFVRDIYIRGWKIDEKMMEVFSKCLPASQNLHTINLWNVGLTDVTIDLLADILPRCPNVKTLVLDGNPLPQQTYFRLFGEDSMLAHIVLRNNKIDNEGVWFIAQALQDQQLSNKHLVSLNLSYNHISDLGVSYLAEVLRMNRSLLYLSLAHNEVGDEGALCLAQILGHFALTTQEIVERRFLLLNKESPEQHILPSPTRLAEGKLEHPQSLSGGIAFEKTEKEKAEKAEKQQTTKSVKSASKRKDKEQVKKEEKAGAINQAPASGPGGSVKKEDTKLKKQTATSDTKAGRGKERKSATREKSITVQEPEPQETTEILHPLLEPVEQRDGQIFLLGNRNLINLNLSMNKITERGLKGLLVALENQGQTLKSLRGTLGGTGLLRLSLGRNNFSLDNPTFLKIQELMAVRDPIAKTAVKSGEEEQMQA